METKIINLLLKPVCSGFILRYDIKSSQTLLVAFCAKQYLASTPAYVWETQEK